jgi:hypothetical protein
MKLLWVESLKLARIRVNGQVANNNNILLNVLEVWYKFNEPFDPCVEACTSFYEFSGTEKLAGWVGYWTPTLPHSRLSASHHHHRMRPPPHHYH